MLYKFLLIIIIIIIVVIIITIMNTEEVVHVFSTSDIHCIQI